MIGENLHFDTLAGVTVCLNKAYKYFLRGNRSVRDTDL